MASFVLLGVIWVLSRDLLAHVIGFGLGHVVVEGCIVVRLANDVRLSQRTNSNLEEGDLVVVVWSHVEEVVLINHEVMPDMPSFLINDRFKHT